MTRPLGRRAALAASLLPFAARGQPARPLVVASFSILEDMVARIAGSAVRVTSLVPRDGDPHALQPRPGDLSSLRQAAVVVENGLGLEGWLSRLVEAAGFNGVRIMATAGITPRHMDEGGADAPDPHVWQDPALAIRLVQTVAEGLAKADPAGAAAYRQGGANYAAELTLLDAAIKQSFAPIPKERRKVLTTHDAFAYYGARYGVEFIALQGISTEAEPSPRALARVAAQAKAQGIRSVFLENMTDPRLAQALAREARLTVGPKLYSDSLSKLDGPAPTYLQLLRYNTAQFAASMTG